MYIGRYTRISVYGYMGIYAGILGVIKYIVLLCIMLISHANYLTIHVNPTENDMAYGDMPRPMERPPHIPLVYRMEPLTQQLQEEDDPGQDLNSIPNVCVNTYSAVVLVERLHYDCPALPLAGADDDGGDDIGVGERDSH